MLYSFLNKISTVVARPLQESYKKYILQCFFLVGGKVRYGMDWRIGIFFLRRQYLDWRNSGWRLQRLLLFTNNLIMLLLT